MTDQDLYGDLRFDVIRSLDQRVEFHYVGAARHAAERQAEGDSPRVLSDIGDTTRSRTMATVYEANLVFKEALPGMKRVRIGRQSGTRDEAILFDGVSMEVGGDTLNLSLYGGASLHLYEYDSHWGDDTLGGAGLDLDPMPGTVFSADYLEIRDRRVSSLDDRSLRDRMTSFKLRQRFEPATRIMVRYRLLNDDPRDVSVNLTAASAGLDADVQASYLRQFRTQNELSTEFSPFAEVLGSSAAYQSYDIKLRKSFTDRVAMDAGYVRRDLLDSAASGPFNKDYDRSFVDAELSRFVFPGLSLTVMAEQWRSGGAAYRATGFDLTHRSRRVSGREVRVSAGNYYSLYKYDYYLDLNERQRVRTWYVNALIPLPGRITLTGGYEYEQGIERYQSVRAGVRHDF